MSKVVKWLQVDYMISTVIHACKHQNSKSVTLLPVKQSFHFSVGVDDDIRAAEGIPKGYTKSSAQHHITEIYYTLGIIWLAMSSPLST
jgi:hypothetical protein